MEDKLNPDLDPDLYETDQSTDKEAPEHLRSHYGPNVATCSGIIPPRTEEAEQE